MGGPGSGRQPEYDRTKPAPLSETAKERLWKGRLRGKLARGLAGATTEFQMRLIELYIDGEITDAQKESLRRDALALNTMEQSLEGKRMRETMDKTREVMEGRRKPGLHLRNAGQPPDSMASAPTTPSTGV